MPACSPSWACASSWWRSDRACSNSPTRNHRGSVLPSPRSPRHDAIERRSRQRGETPEGGSRQPKSNKRIVRRCAALCGGPAGNVDGLNLAAAGLEADNRGRIAVDAEYRKPRSPGIFAVGDVIGFPSLASVSMEQGRMAAAHRLRSENPLQSGQLPVRHLHHSGNFVRGENEEQLTDEDVPYEVGLLLSRNRARPDQAATPPAG